MPRRVPAPQPAPGIVRLTEESAPTPERDDGAFALLGGARRPPFLAEGSLFARRYRIGERIGAGGMGIVYGATEIATGEPVAIKVLGTGGSATSQNARRFRREGQTAARVRNRHCCRVLGVGVDRAVQYLVMERLEGETLRRRLRDTGPLPAAEAVAITLQMLDGLSAAHAAGVLHRDVKPGNIFILTPRGAPPSIKIIDFGLAKPLPITRWEPRASLPPEEMSAITTTDVVPGTPMYLAPEQIHGDRDLDERVDVWAAGMTLFEMLTNDRAFSGSSYVVLAKAIALDPPPPLAAYRSDLPSAFEPIIARALAKRREDRFASTAEFRAKLLAEWAKIRAAGVVRGEQLRDAAVRKERPLARRPVPRAPLPSEPEQDELTQVDVDIHFEPE